MGEEAAKCQFKHERLPGYQCPYTAEIDQKKGGRVCVFHWDPQDEEEKRQKAELFGPRFARLVQEFEKKTEEEQKKNPLDCQGFIFPATFSYFDHGKVPPASFGEATFGEGAWFG